MKAGGSVAKRVQRQKLKKQKLKNWQRQQAQRQSTVPQQSVAPKPAQAMAKNLALLSEKAPVATTVTEPPTDPLQATLVQLKQNLPAKAYLAQVTVPTADEQTALADVVGHPLPASYQKLLATIGPFYGGGYLFAGSSRLPAGDLLYLNQALRADLLPEATTLCVFAVSKTHFLAYDFQHMTTATEPVIVSGNRRGYQRVARQLGILLQQINAKLKK